MTVSLSKPSDIIVDTMGHTMDRAGDEIIMEAITNAARLAAEYNVVSYRHTDELGLCFLTSARRTRGGLSTTYANERAIINNYNAALAIKLNARKDV